ncbi:MAG TPA: peptide deformylase [Actinomycetota bacterium]
MAILPIRTLGDPVLRQPASPVEEFDDPLRALADDMIETMHEAPGVGLAAPQVGRAVRLIVFDVGEGPIALANPTLSGHDGEQIGEEGCLSIPGLYFEVRRAMKVTADGFDLHGEPVRIEGEELLARVLQHEVDHIDGILFIDRLDEEERKRAMAELRRQELGLAPTSLDPSRAL